VFADKLNVSGHETAGNSLILRHGLKISSDSADVTVVGRCPVLETWGKSRVG